MFAFILEIAMFARNSARLASEVKSLQVAQSRFPDTSEQYHLLQGQIYMRNHVIGFRLAKLD